MSILAKTAMVFFIALASLEIVQFWGGALFGAHTDVWEEFELGLSDVRPNLVTLLLGAGLQILAFAGLAVAFLSIWRTLNGGRGQDFRLLAVHLRRTGMGLIVFWVADQLMWISIPYLLSRQEGAVGTMDPLMWIPIGIELVFLILAVALLAISQTLERAWLAEDEVRHLL